MAEERLNNNNLRLFEDWLDDIEPELAKEQSAKKSVLKDTETEEIIRDEKEFSHTLIITIRVFNKYELDEMHLNLKEWVSSMNDIFANYQLFEDFYIGKMRIEDANYSGRLRPKGTFEDKFSEDFYPPFDETFDLIEFYKSKGQGRYGMIPYVYVYVWFNPSDTKMPYHRFMNQYYNMSMRLWRKFDAMTELEPDLSFAFYNNADSKYSINRFRMEAGSVHGINNPLKTLYNRLYDEKLENNYTQNKKDDIIPVRLANRVSERLEYYIKNMAKYGREKHNLNFFFVDRCDWKITSLEEIRKMNYDSIKVPKIISFRVDTFGAKSINISDIEDTIINGFLTRFPSGTLKSVYFIFIVQCMMKLVDDIADKNKEKLNGTSLNWKEKRNLKDHPTVMDYNEKTLYRATTESAEMYNSESSSRPRKLQWRVREGKMIGENSQFNIIMPDKKGKICRANNYSLYSYSQLKTFWKTVCDMIDSMN